MGALGNAASLMTNQEWSNWMTAAACFVAAEVYSEATSTADYDIRRRLALDVLTVPTMITSRLVSLVSTTATVAVVGPVPSDAHEAPVLARVRQLWTKIAESTYPEEV
jgi:hypothetical protein